jgi:5-methylcytosine-specific restriction enzyme subunit McrC
VRPSPTLPQLRLREWESQERGIVLSERDRDLARHLRADQRLVVDELRTGVRFSATSWVGLVRFDALEVRVIPKLAGGNVGLVRMIEVATGLRALHRLPAVRPLLTDDSGLLDLIAILFAEATDAVLRGGLFRDYLEREEELPVLRGRILVREQVLRRFGRIDRLACRFDDLESDILENRLIAAALRTCRSRIDDAGVRRRVAALHTVFEQVCEPDPLDFDEAWSALHYHRLNEHYRDAHALARLLLEGLGTRDLLSPGHARSFVFMIDMNQLFERFVLRVVERALEGTDWQVHYQARTPPVIWDVNLKRVYTHVVPDLTVAADGHPPRLLPVDAKYKLYDDRPLDPTDLYQAFLYAYAYHLSDSTAPIAALVYPSEMNVARGIHLRIRSETGPTGAEVFVMGLPVQALLDELTAGGSGPLLRDLAAGLKATLKPDVG